MPKLFSLLARKEARNQRKLDNLEKELNERLELEKKENKQAKIETQNLLSKIQQLFRK